MTIDKHYEVIYKRKDNYSFINKFKTEEKAREYIFNTCEKHGFNRYICIKAMEDGYLYNRDRYGKELEIKLVISKFLV